MRVSFLPKVSFAVCAVLASSLVQAERGVGISRWQAEVSGNVRAVGERLDLRRDLNVEGDPLGRLMLERGPLQLGFGGMSFRGTGQVDRPVTFGGLQLSEESATIVTRAQFADLSARYLWRVLPGVRVGATLRSLSGEVDVSDGSEREVRRFSETIPQIAAALAWPEGAATQIHAGGEWIGYEDDALWEWRAQARWQQRPWAVMLGYAARRYRLRSTTDELDARLRGMFLAAELRW